MVATTPRYRAAPGSLIGKADAEAVGHEIEVLARHNDQGVNAEMVVEAARAPGSALHKYIEWDDATASHEYRLAQARGIIRSIQINVVVMEGPEPERAWTRKFHHVTVSAPEDEPVTRYVPVELVVTRPTLLAQIVGDAYGQMVGWRERYRTYQGYPEFEQFRALFEAIDRLKEEHAAD